jgi:uncharacterized protein YjiS (DUF1127 family)
MSASAAVQAHPISTGWPGRQWDTWKRRRRAIAEVAQCTSDERGRLARDLGVSEYEFCSLARKPGDASALLYERLDQLQLKAAEIREVEPLLLRDLQRVCSLCASKRKCKRDFDKRPWSKVWKDYCPNALTLSALQAQRPQQKHFQDDCGRALYDVPRELRYATATIDPMGESILQMLQCAPPS